MDEDKISRIVIGFWKKLIVEKLGMYLLIDGVVSVLFFLIFDANPSILLAVFVTGIPRYLVGAVAGARCLHESVHEVSKE